MEYKDLCRLKKDGKKAVKIAAVVLFSIQFICFRLGAQITWPEGQVLPSFPTPAQTQDLFYLSGKSAEERYLLSSLKGIVNLKQPRMFVYDGDAHAEGPYSWLNSLGLNWVEYSDNWQLVAKYKDEVEGLVVYDPAQIHTVNLATILAGEKKALIASPSLLTKLTSEPYNFPILDDLRGKYANRLEVYQDIFDTYWPAKDHRLLIGIHPEHHQGSLREYAVAVGAAVIWLDPEISGESELLNKFFGSMPDGANYMGWWPQEAPGVMRGSTYGIPTIASDYCSNLTVHSGMPRQVNVKPVPPKPPLQNKIYVAFVLSDGDNLQFVEHLFKKLWENPDRGLVPLGWTISPAMVDAMPGALNYFHESATDNDNLVSGPSGYGYAYPNFFPDENELHNFIEKTEEYNRKSGIRVITIWNTITGGINEAVGKAFADKAPTTLGLTAQNTGGGLTVYNNSLPGMALTCNYCWNVENMLMHIGYGTEGWDGNSPRFLIIQCNPWEGASPTTFKTVMQSLNSDYVVVRPDHIFQLMREANGLPVNPSSIYGNGDGLKGEYFNGINFDSLVAEKIDKTVNFNWETSAPYAGVKSDSFSVRWTGQVQPLYSEEYTFFVSSNDGAKLTINDSVLFDGLLTEGATIQNGNIALQSGKKYTITLEYLEKAGNAACKLEWQSASQERQVVPEAQLYPFQTVLSASTGTVTAYEGASFNGFSASLQVGEYTSTDLKSIGHFDKNIGSLAIQPGYKVVLFSEDDFAGNSLELVSDTGDLGDWTDMVSSLKVKTAGFEGLSGTYILQNRENSLYMEVAGGVVAKDERVNIRQNNLTSKTNQQFNFEHLGDGAYKILATHSKKALNVSNNNLADSANVNQLTYSGLANQRFIAYDMGDGYIKMKALHSGKIIEAADNNAGGNIWQMADSNLYRGHWKLLPLPEGNKGTGTGLTANYFNGSNFGTLRHTRIDTTINFDWGSGSPHSTVSSDNFSVKWTGYIEPVYSSIYTFYINSDNGRKLYVNDKIIINKWLNDWGIEYSGNVALVAGQKYSIKLEYFEENGGANCKLEWSCDYHDKQLVPKSQLYPEDPISLVPGHLADIGVEIFPNPAKNKIVNIQVQNLQENEQAVVSFFDLTGNLVLQSKVNAIDQLLLDCLVPGVYLAKISSLKVNYNTKIIIE
ncbi:MAG: RICIN domain-containing protein [Bacteroidales bacterium]|nr:RICIN domain-containing protein [Bacteroidales bacterium]